MVRKRIFKIALVFIFLILVAAPFFVGILAKSAYADLVKFCNTNSPVQFTIASYHRGWFGSEVIMHAEDSKTSPTALRFTLVQHIQHGPIFWHPDKNVWMGVGAGLIQGTLASSGAAKQGSRGSKSFNSFFKWQDHISFNQSHRILLQSDGGDLFAFSGNSIQFENLVANVHVWPGQQRIKVKIKIVNSEFTGLALSSTIPNALIKFDKRLSATGLWLGSSDIVFPEIQLKDEDNRKMVVTELQTQGYIEEISKLLRGSREISYNKIIIDNNDIGSLKLSIRFKNMNPKPFATLFMSNSKKTSNISPFYFYNKFSSVFPGLLASTSTFDLDKLQVIMLSGSLQANARLAWPKGVSVKVKTLNNAVLESEGEGELRISVALADDLFGVAADIYYLNHAFFRPQYGLMNKEGDSIFTAKQNQYLIAGLIQGNRLPNNEGLKLLQLQKASVSAELYFAEINKLAFNKVITSNTADLLHAQYDKIKFSLLSPMQRRTNIEKELRDKLDYLVQKGYVVKDKNVYSVKLKYFKNILKLNEHVYL